MNCTLVNLEGLYGARMSTDFNPGKMTFVQMIDRILTQIDELQLGASMTTQSKLIVGQAMGILYLTAHYKDRGIKSDI